ncbi:MAG: hypothetical protein CVT98_02270 [Bacteroidetes bacterium HGW-Bacteroidetes-15]|nr:MAG: hypothetical protein CVT98_02270 [Bacteroidetes bacterium HGW-Bacteroidetes-15]
MNKIAFTLTLLLFSSITFAQSLVAPATLNFVRPANTAGAFSSIKILVNDQHIGDIQNASTFSYKLFISAKSSITLNVNSAIYNKTISFDVEPGKTYSFETSFVDQGLFLLAIDEAAYSRHTQVLQANQQNTGQAALIASGTKSQEAIGASQPTSQLDINKKDGSVSYQYEKELDSEAIRKQWLANGGSLTGTSFVGGLSVLYQDTEDIVLSGGGLNVALNQNLFNLKVPEYKAGPSSWNSFHFGYGVAASMNSVTIEFYGFDMDPIESTSYQLDLNLNLGLTLGLGRFIDRANWRGVAVELNYRPTYSTYIPEEGDAISNFNFSGFSFDINGSNFTASMNKIAPKAQMKLSFFVLPPVGDMPFFMSINLGALWYSK